MRLRRTVALVLASAVVLAVPVAANAAGGRPPGRLQSTLDAVVAAGAPGAVLEFRENGRVEREASGVAEFDGRPAPVDGRFRIGSVTKTFVATVVLQLADEGRLRLDDPVERWLPGVVPGGDKIPVRMLLNHTSGLYNYTEDLYPTNEDLVRERYKHWAPGTLIAMATAHAPDFPPGTSWAYSNTNFVLLGQVIEKVTGRSYGTEIQRRVLNRAGLRDTTVPGDLPFIVGPHAHGYVEVAGKPVDITAFNPSVASSAGEIVSTTADLNRFFGALLAGRLTSRAALADMMTVVPGEIYGLGLISAPLSCGVTVFGHTGGIPGYATYSFHTADLSRQLSMSVTAYAASTGTADMNVLQAAFCPGTGAAAAPIPVR